MRGCNRLIKGDKSPQINTYVLKIGTYTGAISPAPVPFAGFCEGFRDERIRISFGLMLKIKSRNAQNLSPRITLKQQNTISLLGEKLVKKKIKSYKRKGKFYPRVH